MIETTNHEKRMTYSIMVVKLVVCLEMEEEEEGKGTKGATDGTR